jgi:hypothetical protein
MDVISIGVVILLGAAVAWMVVRAFSNSKHSPPTRIRGGLGGIQAADHLAQMGFRTAPKPPKPGLDAPEGGSPRR